MSSQKGKAFRHSGFIPAKDTEFTSDRMATSLLFFWRAEINRLKKGTSSVQKHTGKIGKNGVRPASESLEPYLLEPLHTREGAQEELDFVLREGEAGDLNLLLMAIAKAQGGLSKLARETGLSRENLYGALSFEGKPRFETI